MSGALYAVVVVPQKAELCVPCEPDGYLRMKVIAGSAEVVIETTITRDGERVDLGSLFDDVLSVEANANSSGFFWMDL